MSISAEIISIGNELLYGLTANTNASYLAERLTGMGIKVNWISTIADTPEEIVAALQTAGNRARLIMVTGGLGPTPDDLTKKAICSFFNTKLILHEPILDHIRGLFEGRNMRMPEINRNQAMIPAKAVIIQNDIGTAPGLEFIHNNKIYFFLPGVPHEMKHIADSYIVNKLQQFYTLEPQTQYLFRTNGLAESKLLEKVEETLDRFSDYSYSFLPKSSGVDLRIKAADRKNINPQLLARLRKDIGAYIYSEKEETLAEVISKLMQNNNLTLAVAESFTGGVLSDWITNIPGSSAYYLGGVITYSNESKITQLGVDQQTLNSFGAVSAETVEEMVRGVQELFKSDCSIASTGIAGPTGATAQKPVGLCYLAACFNDQVQTRKFNFGYNRRIVKERGAAAGLDLLRRLLLAQKDLELI